ncbi:MAG: MOFRL family protein, partial [Edaphobacter sp.]
DNACDDWNYRAAAEYLLNRLRGLRSEHPKVCLISAGEVTVELPSMNAAGSEEGQNVFGAGGRNQHFSLYAATLLGPSDASTVILSAGSDGIDGNSVAAGAVVDEQTLQKRSGRGAEAQRALQDFDSYTFLERVGGTIVTGATGNNLRDLRILLAERPAP